jgi:hypothetical protein
MDTYPLSRNSKTIGRKNSGDLFFLKKGLSNELLGIYINRFTLQIERDEFSWDLFGL